MVGVIRIYGILYYYGVRVNSDCIPEIPEIARTQEGVYKKG